jgi:hypothetical protein
LQPFPSEVQIGRLSNETHTLPLPPEASDPTDMTSEVSQPRLERDTAGESSFRFHDFSLSSNWVWYILYIVDTMILLFVVVMYINTNYIHYIGLVEWWSI